MVALIIETYEGYNGQYPIIAFNNTGVVQGSWQPNTFSVHPASDQLAIIAWESRYNGYISVSGSVKTYTYDSANRLKSVSGQSTVNSEQLSVQWIGRPLAGNGQW
jgi:hypothetical protein